MICAIFKLEHPQPGQGKNCGNDPERASPFLYLYAHIVPFHV